MSRYKNVIPLKALADVIPGSSAKGVLLSAAGEIRELHQIVDAFCMLVEAGDKVLTVADEMSGGCQCRIDQFDEQHVGWLKAKKVLQERIEKL